MPRITRLTPPLAPSTGPSLDPFGFSFGAGLRRAVLRRAAVWSGLFLMMVATVGAPALAQTEGSGTTASSEFWLPQDLLPPELPWEGASQRWMAAADDPWVTPAEREGLEVTPDYEATVAYLQRLAAATPKLQLVSIGSSARGRSIWMAVVSAEGHETPAALAASGKPVLLAHGGIHSGEIDGKDAGLMLLRDLTVGAAEGSDAARLLEGAHLLFIPILNPDGHERSGSYHRVNQRGPREMGWRTNARNLNLNRDFAKLDTQEVRSLVRVIEGWQPDLYLDLHVTDGADYQYDITFGANGPQGWSPSSARWLREVLEPALSEDLRKEGHIPGPLVFLMDGADPSQGNFGWLAGPRFSNGYGDARQLPTLLVENHSLKPYPQRVLGTYVLLRSAMAVLAREAAPLQAAITEDRAARRDPVPLSFQVAQDEEPPRRPFLGVESRMELSAITGRPVVRYTGRPVTLSVPLLEASEPAVVVERPRAYWIPPEWADIARRLQAHGIEVEIVGEAREVMGTSYHLENPELDSDVFEGRLRVAATARPQAWSGQLPAGSFRVATDQPLGTLAVLLLEPQSPDSFFQWGFLHSVLQRTEYIETYVVEPLAQRMLEADEELAKEFRQRLKEDPEFAASPRQRLDFFYRRTPYYDAQFLRYPFVREEYREHGSQGSPPS